MRHKQRVKSGKLKVKSVGMATLISFTFSLSITMAQESINATGNNATGSGGSVSYSVGQVTYQTHTGTDGSVAQGVQQPYEISLATGIGESIPVSFNAKVYPNPATDYLMLKVDQVTHLQSFNYHLYDVNGKLLENKHLENSETSISIDHLPSGTYFLHLKKQNDQGSYELINFKIVKY